MIRITRDDFSVDKVLSEMRSRSTGALVSFVGVVRSEPDHVLGLEIEVYQDMAEKMLHDIRAHAIEEFSLDNVAIVHRFGQLNIGENIVLVVAASPHRQEALRATEWIMDEIKASVPLWKKERTASGTRWIGGDR